MGLLQLLKQLKSGEITEDQIIDFVKSDTETIVNNRVGQVIKRYESKSGGDSDSGDETLNALKNDNANKTAKIEELLKLVQDNEQAKKGLGEQLAQLKQERESIIEQERAAIAKKVDEFKLGTEKAEAKFGKLQSLYKQEKLLNVAGAIASNLNLKNPSLAAEYLVNMGYLDLVEAKDEQGNFTGFQPVTREIRYTDKDTEKEIVKSFQGEKEVFEGVSILASNDEKIKTLFPVMSDVPSGSGSFNGQNNFSSGSNKPHTQKSREELLKIASGGIIK